MQTTNEENHYPDTKATGMSMSSNSRAFERCCKAAMVGAAVPVILSLAAGTASWYKTGSFSSLYVCVLYIWVATPEFTLFGVIPSAIAGAIGGAVGRTGRASLYGAMILACVVGEYLWFGGWKTWPIATNISLIAFMSAVGALAGGVGAVIARTIPTADDDQAIPLRLSLWESVIAGILVAMLLGCMFLLTVTEGRIDL